MDLREDVEQETEETWKMKAVDVDAHSAFPQGVVLLRDRDWLSMWREDVGAAALYEQAEANKEYLYFHDYTDSRVAFGRHRGKTCGQVFKEHPDYARWANRQQTSQPPLLLFAKYVRDVLEHRPYPSEPYPRVYPATTTQGPTVTTCHVLRRYHRSAQ